MNNNSLNYQLQIIKSNRKTIEIAIKSSDLVIVRVPKHASNKKIQEVIDKKQEWIIKHLEHFKLKQPIVHQLNYEPESQWALFDEVLTLQYKVEAIPKKPYLQITDDTLLVCGTNNPKIVRQLLIKYINEKLAGYLQTYIMKYKQILQVDIKDIRIKKQRTVWGSCSSKHNMNFNIMVGFAPTKVIEYLVIHELCHLIHMNHSKDYWTLVGSLMPDYKLHRRWLKEHSYMLNPQFF